jgi:imidazolonepropionase-like amidohydrolase
MDLNGHTVIPGLVGLHDHSFYGGGGWPYAFSAVAVPRLYVAAGVTTTRTTGSLAPYDELNLYRSIQKGSAIGPRMFITGPYLNSGVPALTAMVRVETAEDGARVVRYWAEEGVTWIKAYANITRAALGGAIQEAHKHGIKVTAHLCSVGFREAIALGIDALEHGLTTDYEFHPNKKLDECPREPMDWGKVDMNSPEVQQTFKDMVSHNVPLTSTLAVYETSLPNRPPLDPRVMDAMYEGVRTSYLTNRARIPAGRSDVPFKKAMEFERAFVKAGGLLAAGVDPTGNAGALPGYGDQRNYELLIEAGFTPVEAIQILTGNGAKALGKFAEFGSVTAGKSADLVVIRGNPIATPAEIRNVTIVFKQGLGFDSPKLIESIKGQVGLH